MNSAYASLIVSTTLDGLEAVFACMDQSDPRILVDPNRAERVLALGEVMAKLRIGERADRLRAYAS